VIGIFVAGMLLIAIQGVLWVHSVASARTETDKQNIEGHQPPTELPGIGGSLLFVLAALIASIPERASSRGSRT
jgi:hypothetical protein